MIQRLEEVTGARPTTAPERGIEHWLDALMKLLRLPQRERALIQDELREHLEERVRDLVLSGEHESTAVQRALAELGEMAELAGRLRSAHRWPRRRLIMNGSILVVGAGLLTGGVMMFTGATSSVSQSIFEEVGQATTPPEHLQEIRFALDADATAGELIDFIAASGVGVTINWGAMQEVELYRDEALGLTSSELPLPRVLELLAERFDAGWDRLDWRFADEGIVFGTRSYFDQKERTLIAYDIIPIFDEGVGEDEITELLMTFASPDDWMDNGGELAHQQIVNGRLFIEAPPRIHQRVEWLLDELRSSGQEMSLLPAGVDRVNEERASLLRERADVLQQWQDAIDKYQPGHPQIQQLEQRLSAIQRQLADDIDAGDVLTVRIYELFSAGQWYEVTQRMTDAGSVRLPEVGEVPAVGLTEAEFEEALRHKLAEIMPHPLVIVQRGDVELTRASRTAGNPLQASGIEQ